MFTGLIEEIGEIQNIQTVSGGKMLFVKANFTPELKIGESVAINGACQSVVNIEKNTFSVFSMQESLLNTNFNFLKQGSKVNLERAMVLGSRLDGHIVSGHIDGVAKLKNKTQIGLSTVFEFEYDTKYIIYKGSVAINGISLTVSKVKESSFEVSVIPQTLERTNLNSIKTGEIVNIEVDMFAKYIEKFLSANNNKSKLSEDFLKENGF